MHVSRPEQLKPGSNNCGMPPQHHMKVEPKKSKRIKRPKPINILVPTDFSRNAAEALRFAVPLARQLGGKITLLHAIDLEVISGMLSAIRIINAMNKSANEDAAHRLDKLARTTVPPELLEKKVVRFAPPHVGIPETARELKMDLIVISTQGCTGLHHVLLCSTPPRFVRHSSCPVLTLRPPPPPTPPRPNAPRPSPSI